MLQVEEVSSDARLAAERILGRQQPQVELQPLDGAVGPAHGEQVGRDADFRGKGEKVVRVRKRRRQTRLIVARADERRALTPVAAAGRRLVAFRADDAVAAEAAARVDADLVGASAVGRAATAFVDVGAGAMIVEQLEAGQTTAAEGAGGVLADA